MFMVEIYIDTICPCGEEREWINGDLWKEANDNE